VPPADQSLPYDVLPLSGVSYGDDLLRNDDDVKRLGVVPRSRVVTASPDEPQPVPSSRMHLGCISVRLSALGFPTWSGNLRRGGGVTHWAAERAYRRLVADRQAGDSAKKGAGAALGRAS